MRTLKTLICGLAVAAAGWAQAATTDITIIGKPAPAQTAQQAAAAAATAASTGVLRVYDGSKKLVGQVISSSASTSNAANSQTSVIVKINNATYQTKMTPGGFTAMDSAQVTFYHVASDCSDVRYVDANALPPLAFVNSGTIYYPTTVQPYNFMALEIFDSGVDMSTKGYCIPNTTSGYAGPVATISASSLGFVSPFSAKTP